MTPDGLVICPSSHGPDETMDRLVAAAKVGMELRPTDVVLFGNPKAGTPLMQAVQTIGIDLPLKALVWQDADGKTWLAYTDPAGLARRHRVPAGMERTLSAMADVLAAIAKAAT